MLLQAKIITEGHWRTVDNMANSNEPSQHRYVTLAKAHDLRIELHFPPLAATYEERKRPELPNLKIRLFSTSPPSLPRCYTIDEPTPPDLVTLERNWKWPANDDPKERAYRGNLRRREKNLKRKGGRVMGTPLMPMVTHTGDRSRWGTTNALIFG